MLFCVYRNERVRSITLFRRIFSSFHLKLFFFFLPPIFCCVFFWSSNKKKSRHHLSEQFVETSMAVGLIVLLLERALVQCFETEGAHKMFGMEFPEHGCYATSSYWFRAASAQWATFRMVMRFTIWQSWKGENVSLTRCFVLLSIFAIIFGNIPIMNEQTTTLV